MSSGTSRKKRLSLQDVVDKLSLRVLEKFSGDVEPEKAKPLDEPSVPVLHEKRRSSSHRLHLAKAFAAPSSPNVSEASTEDAPISDKEIIDELPKESGPVEPMRCGVCGLRVYKSYRYISRSSAPVHLKIFFDPETERFRVCKRCFSSKERCRQNLALLLLKSQTEENSHLRSPLGTTQGRRTQGLKYIFRDIGRSLKRPYEDLICDETFDEDYLSDGDENTPLKAVKKEPISAKKFNNFVENPAGTGIVTVVRPSSNVYQVYPNHFTIYGELGQNKTIEADGKLQINKDITTIKATTKLPEEKAAEKDEKDQSTNGELKSEIRTINYKLTLLDHAYALPAAKTVKPYKPAKPVLENLPKMKSDAVAKAAIKNMIKNNSVAAKKIPSATSSSTGDKTGQPTRTCGIICSMCKNLVTKSYSCYRKENAPDKIKSYFTGDVKVMKVCRRCVPYKKPKGDTQPTKVVKNKVKILQAKLLKQKIKNAKKASKTEAKALKSEISTQTKEKPSLKSAKEDSKAKAVDKEVKEAKKVEAPVVHLSPKKDTTVVHVSIKNGKVESSSNNVIQTIFPPIGNADGNDMKNDSNKPKTNNQKAAQKTDVEVKTVASGQQLGSVMLVHLKAPLGLETILDKDKNGGNTRSVDFGTQPMHSMIGVKKTKSKTTKKDEESEKKNERKQGKDTTKGDASKIPEVKKNTESVKEKEVEKESKAENHESKEKEKEKEKETVTKDKELKTKIKAEQIPETQLESGAVRKLNVDVQNTKVEVKMAKPANTKPLIEPVRSSPRRDKNIIPPEKTNKEEPKNTTALAAAMKLNEEKPSEDKAGEKTEAAPKRPVRKGRSMKRKDSESETSSTAGSVDGERKEMKRARSAETKSTDSEKKNEITLPVTNHSYSTRWAQSPIKCGCCHENVVKSYRCVQLGSSPAHLKPVFSKEAKNTLRICRKCLNFPSRVKSFL